MAQRAGRLQKWSAFLIDLAAGVSGRCATSTAMPRHDAPDSSSSPVARSLWGGLRYCDVAGLGPNARCVLRWGRFVLDSARWRPSSCAPCSR